jgi:mycoredoxin
MTTIDFAQRPASRQISVPVAIYGNSWCGMTQMVRRGLDRAGVDYQYVDLDLHPDVDRKLRRLGGPGLRTPVVYVDGEWLTAPSLREVQSALMRHGGAW